LIAVYVISLARATKRRASIVSLLDALSIPHAIMEATDGNHMTDAQANSLAPSRNRLALRWPLSKGEIGCAASHRAAIRRIVDTRAEFGCIMEDDARPGMALPGFLDVDWLRQLPPFDILKLTGDRASKRDDIAMPISNRHGYRICAPVHPSYGASGYVVSGEGAERLLRRLDVIDDTSDVMMFRSPMTIGRFLDVRPNLVARAEFDSLLHADRGRNAQMAWWRPLASWGPHRLALIRRKVRRYVAFGRAWGFGGFRRTENIPLVAFSHREVDRL
jgi:glycosyl transferase family 25